MPHHQSQSIRLATFPDGRRFIVLNLQFAGPDCTQSMAYLWGSVIGYDREKLLTRHGDSFKVELTAVKITEATKTVELMSELFKQAVKWKRATGEAAAIVVDENGMRLATEDGVTEPLTTKPKNRKQPLPASKPLSSMLNDQQAYALSAVQQMKRQLDALERCVRVNEDAVLLLKGLEAERVHLYKALKLEPEVTE